MTKLEKADMFADMWRRSRESKGKSQEYMAKALGVSKKTVQNWEAGTSSPSQLKGFEWFDVLDIPPLPYYLALLYPGEFTDINSDMSDQDADRELTHLIHGLPTGVKKKLLYILYGSHGSSPTAMVEFMTAHLQTPLRDRLNVVQSIETNYELSVTLGTVDTSQVQPDIDVMKSCINKGKEAIKQGKKTYTTI